MTPRGQLREIRARRRRYTRLLCKYKLYKLRFRVLSDFPRIPRLVSFLSVSCTCV